MNTLISKLLIGVLSICCILLQGCQRRECWGCYTTMHIYKCVTPGNTDTSGIQIHGENWEADIAAHQQETGKICKLYFNNYSCYACNSSTVCLEKNMIEDVINSTNKTDTCLFLRYQ